MARLVVIQGPCAQAFYEVAGHSALALGRSPTNDILLDAPSVSRRHARVVGGRGAWWIEDLQSSNGTTVNGRPIARQQLRPGDVVEVGPFRFRFELSPGEKAAPGSGLASGGGGPVVVQEDRPGFTTAVPAAAGSEGVPAGGAAVLARVDTRELAAGQVAADPESLRRKLRVFYKFVDTFGTLLDLDQVLARAVDSLFEIFTQAERACVLLADPQTGALTPRAVRNRTADPEARIAVSRTIVDEAMREGKGILVADSASDERFGLAASVINLKIRSAMCVPLISRKETYGIIHLDTTDQRARFTEDDLYILAGIGAQTAVAIENATLHTELVRNQMRQQDANMAGEVQRSFLPKAVPTLPGYEFFAHYSPALEVGGDFYDFIRLPGGRVAVVVGDVPGKGFSAALMMAKLLSDIRHTALTVSDPRAVVGRINLILATSGSEKAFVTLIYLSLDAAAGELSVVNAGHLPPLVRRAGGALEEPRDASGLPLGVVDHADYGCDLIRVAPGDAVLIYTDGISEARRGTSPSAPAEFYGLDRLRAAVSAAPAAPQGLAEYVLADVRQFVGGTLQSDDITLVCLGRTAG